MANKAPKAPITIKYWKTFSPRQDLISSGISFPILTLFKYLNQNNINNSLKCTQQSIFKGSNFIQTFISIIYLIISLKDKKMKVIVRVRPLSNQQESLIENYQSFIQKGYKDSKKKLSHQIILFHSKFRNLNIRQTIKVQKNTVSVYDQQYKNSQKKMKEFTFSQVFGFNARNSTIFQKQIVQGVNGLIDGYNCTIMAYGITGSGKTYSIFGNTKSTNNQGVSYLAYQYLLNKKEELEKSKHSKVYLKFSFIQIYNENIRDLLSNGPKHQIVLSEDAKGNTHLVDVQQFEIVSIEQVRQLIDLGSARRASAATISNQISSRSHAVLKMSIEIVSQMQIVTSKLFIIDLAGSQKINNVSLLRKAEGININKSLLTLGNCINGLAQNSKKPGGISHIPYRDSKLTRILKDSLGGNAKIIMLACISANPFALQQTTTTLNYAERAQGIKKDVTKNIISSQSQCPKCHSIMPNDYTINNQIKLINSVPTHQFSQIQAISHQFLLRLYNDIVQNARQSQKLQKLRAIMHQPCEELDIVFKAHQTQKNMLHDTLINFFKNRVISTPSLSLNPKSTKSSQKIIRLFSLTRQNSKSKDKGMQSERQNSLKKQSQTIVKSIIQQTKCLPNAKLKINIHQKSVQNKTAYLQRKRSKIQLVKKSSNCQRILTEHNDRNVW